MHKRDLHQIVDEYNACMQGRPSTPVQPTVAAKPAQPAQPEKSTSAWDALESKVKSQPDFEGKSDALEMISEIKGKISASQKVPNFLVEGVKNNLNQEVFKTELENALKELN